ncbi:MAG: TlpA family protein disulfide reductase [Chloroflexi bacterium]|nr:TlpA family protein disulfide reductase [Chloroflexota bacterium]
MGPRTTVMAGLLAGALTAVVVLVAAVLLVPEPSGTAAATPTPSATAGAPDPSSAATRAPSSSLGASSGTANFHVGQRAPDLAIPQLGGGQISLASLAGKPVWVDFMQTTCSPCIDEFPLMNGFAIRYARAGLVVVAVDVREDEGLVTSFAKSLNTQFPVGLDTDGTSARAWDAAALPAHFWIDRAGIIRAGALGGIGPDIMATNLQTILPGVTVTP